MERSLDVPVWNRISDYASYNDNFVITAKFSDSDATFFRLKWGEIK